MSITADFSEKVVWCSLLQSERTHLKGVDLLYAIKVWYMSVCVCRLRGLVMFWFSPQSIVPDMKTILEIGLKQNNGCYRLAYQGKE
ncbi:MAG: hypothetical protein WBZ36_01075 [Candidatus Nitrosopolaris sp.]